MIRTRKRESSRSSGTPDPSSLNHRPTIELAICGSVHPIICESLRHLREVSTYEGIDLIKHSHSHDCGAGLSRKTKALGSQRNVLGNLERLEAGDK